MTLNEKKNQIINEVHRLVNTYAPTMNMPFIKFSNKMTTTGGTASVNYVTGLKTLTFSAPIINNPENDFDHYLSVTVPHEVAHLIDAHRNGRMNGHGIKWKRIMTEISSVPLSDVQRCHNYKVTKRNVQRFMYKCECCGLKMKFTTVRHNKAQKCLREYGTYYTHSACGKSGRMVFVEKVVPKVVKKSTNEVMVGSNIWDNIDI